MALKVSIGASPKGPSGAFSKGPTRVPRVAGGGGSKKGSAGTKAGIGRAPRKPRIFLGAPTNAGPRGPLGAKGPRAALANPAKPVNLAGRLKAGIGQLRSNPFAKGAAIGAAFGLGTVGAVAAAHKNAERQRRRAV